MLTWIEGRRAFCAECSVLEALFCALASPFGGGLQCAEVVAVFGTRTLVLHAFLGALSALWGFGPMSLGDPPPPRYFAPLRLLCSVCVVCLLVLPAGRRCLPRELGRRPWSVYVHAALDAGVHLFALFSLGSGFRSIIPLEQPPN